MKGLNYIYSNVPWYITLDNLYTLQKKINDNKAREQYTPVGMQRHFSDVLISTCVEIKFKDLIKIILTLYVYI